MIRILLNQYVGRHIRRDVETTIYNNEISYWHKLGGIIEHLKTLMEPYLRFR